MSLPNDPLNGPACLHRSTWQAVRFRLSLPDQQARVLSCVLDGRSDKEICAILGVGRPTVRTHLKRLFTRLNAPGRQQLVARFLRLASDIDAKHVILSDDADRNSRVTLSRTDRRRP
ncbi:MAG: helix-turn-helix transcriptional regulator [Phycisphaerales bacterium]|nr:helix-turn-helix transcriptional regulator [Phycisphaerales bacterium]